ncbi:ATP-binding protein [Streptomyces sp. NPDC029526]|uniref:ATP-binding protein n=1 Tax=Streptomyces sp. NPDC029526 TaxID=3155728 RepID=UPI0033F7EBAB
MASVIPSVPLGADAAAGPVALGAAPEATPPGVAAERRFRFELAAHPGSPAQARRLTRARLDGWSVCEDTCDTAALVVSELVTNAIVHTASSRVVCELHDGDDLLRIAVQDEGCAPGKPRAATRQGTDEEHGRGLLLVEALCRSWGAHEHGLGLLVWADLPRGSRAPRDPGDPRDDLGWGARPKPAPTEGPDDAGTESGTESGTEGEDDGTRTGRTDTAGARSANRAEADGPRTASRPHPGPPARQGVPHRRRHRGGEQA